MKEGRMRACFAREWSALGRQGGKTGQLVEGVFGRGKRACTKTKLSPMNGTCKGKMKNFKGKPCHQGKERKWGSPGGRNMGRYKTPESCLAQGKTGGLSRAR